MAKVKSHRVSPPSSTQHRGHDLDLISLAVLFAACAAIALVLVGVAVRGNSPLWLLPPLVLGAVAILHLRPRR